MKLAERYFGIGIVVIMLLTTGCRVERGNDVAESEDLQAFYDEHNARNSLDWVGVYRGVLPCADCEGIETEIELFRDEIYTISRRYLGKDDERVFRDSGDFVWNDAGNTVILQNEDPPNSYFVAENYLVHLDMEGELIFGEIEEKYILRKVLD